MRGFRGWEFDTGQVGRSESASGVGEVISVLSGISRYYPLISYVGQNVRFRYGVIRQLYSVVESNTNLGAR